MSLSIEQSPADIPKSVDLCVNMVTVTSTPNSPTDIDCIPVKNTELAAIFQFLFSSLNRTARVIHLSIVLALISLVRQPTPPMHPGKVSMLWMLL